MAKSKNRKRVKAKEIEDLASTRTELRKLRAQKRQLERVLRDVNKRITDFEQAEASTLDALDIEVEEG